MKNILSLIEKNKIYDFSKVKGYSEDELSKIEKLYDINISGNFRLFMLEMGRCSGGLIGNYPFIFYIDATVREHILAQNSLREDLLRIVSKSYTTFYQYCNGTFMISLESEESQFFYLNTKGDNPERVFRFDDNMGIIYDTEQDFLDYLLDTVKNYKEYYSERVICTGELLNII